MQTETAGITNNDGTYTLKVSVSGLKEHQMLELQDQIEAFIAEFAEADEAEDESAIA